MSEEREVIDIELESGTLEGESEKESFTRKLLAPHNRHAIVSEFFSHTIGGRDNQDTLSTANEFKKRVNRVKNGDMSDIESMLVSQSLTLDSIFADMAFRSSIQADNYPKVANTYMNMALKAQSQCRCTIEALNEIKNPKSVTITKQANIAGQQVVNNGTINTESSRTEEKKQSKSNELLEVIEHDKVDTGTKGETIQSNKTVETVGAVNRCKDSKGKS